MSETFSQHPEKAGHSKAKEVTSTAESLAKAMKEDPKEVKESYQTKVQQYLQLLSRFTGHESDSVRDSGKQALQGFLKRLNDEADRFGRMHPEQHQIRFQDQVSRFTADIDQLIRSLQVRMELTGMDTQAPAPEPPAVKPQAAPATPAEAPEQPESVLDDLQSDQDFRRETAVAERSRTEQGNATKAAETAPKAQTETLAFTETRLMTEELSRDPQFIQKLTEQDITSSLAQLPNLLRRNDSERTTQLTYNFMTILDEENWDTIITQQPLIARHKPAMERAVQQMGSAINERYSAELTPERQAEIFRQLEQARKEGETSVSQWAENIYEGVVEGPRDFMDGFKSQLQKEGKNMSAFVSALGDDFPGTLQATWDALNALKTFITTHPEEAKDSVTGYIKGKLSTAKGTGELVASLMLTLLPGAALKAGSRSSQVLSYMQRISSKAPGVGRVTSNPVFRGALRSSVRTGQLSRSASKIPIFEREQFQSNLKKVTDTLMARAPEGNPLYRYFLSKLQNQPEDLLKTPKERAAFVRLLADMDAYFNANGTISEDHQRDIQKLYVEKSGSLNIQEDPAFQKALRQTITALQTPPQETPRPVVKMLQNPQNIGQHQDREQLAKLVVNIKGNLDKNNTVTEAQQRKLREISSRLS